jgi:hypothetical protein
LAPPSIDRSQYTALYPVVAAFCCSKGMSTTAPPFVSSTWQ